MMQSCGKKTACDDAASTHLRRRARRTTEYISDNACKACPSGHTCDGIDATACAAPKYVQNNACTDCPSGHTCDGTTATACAGGDAAEDQAALRGADDARPRIVGAREASLRALGEYLGVIAL